MKVVLLHALPLDASMWCTVAQGLGHEVVAPDLYQWGSTLEEWAPGVLRLAGAGPLVVVGSSVGGSCAIEVARLAPEAVRHLVLIGAKPGHRPDPAYRDAAVRLLETHGMEAAWPAYWEGLLAPTTPAATAEAIRQIAESQRVEDVVRGVRAFHGRADRSQFLHEWPGPVTVVSGKYDIASERSRALAAGLRDGRYAMIAGAGHYSPLENPDSVRAIVANAVAEAVLGSGSSYHFGGLHWRSQQSEARKNLFP